MRLLGEDMRSVRARRDLASTSENCDVKTAASWLLSWNMKCSGKSRLDREPSAFSSNQSQAIPAPEKARCWTVSHRWT
jgi:hypothetical protein